MNKPVIFLDMDGCLASQGKVWSDYTLTTETGTAYPTSDKRLSVQKIISDHDSWCIDHYKKQAHIVIISGDKRINKAWAKRRGVPFIYTCADGFHQEKWEHLQKYWFENIAVDVGDYYYLGDCMPDFRCMLNAKKAFYPTDAACFLKNRPNIELNFKKLESKSGEGCFEEMCWLLVQDGVLKYE